MNKTIAIIVGIVVGFITWIITKLAILIGGAYVLSQVELTGSRVYNNLSAISEIAGFLVCVLVAHKIYQKLHQPKESPASQQHPPKR